MLSTRPAETPSRPLPIDSVPGLGARAMIVETSHLRVVNGSGERRKKQARRAPAFGLADIRRTANGCLEYRVADGDAATGQWLPLSSPIYVRALPRDPDGRNWGRLVEVQNPDGGVN